MTKPKTPEGEIKAAILEYLRIRFPFPRGTFWVNHTTGIWDPRKRCFRKNPGRKGVSDILGSVGGRLVAIEVKTPDGRLNPDQKSFISDVHTTGAVAFMARSVEEVEKEMNRYFAPLAV